MRARLHQIVSKTKAHPVQPAQLDHFSLDEGVEVDATTLVTNRNWTLHGLDHDTQQALFVELPERTDLGTATFCYVDQYDLAKAVMLVPYDTLIRLADTMTGSPNPVFVFNIGRCGSTLLSKIFAEVPGVWSLSEPDALSNLTQDRHRTPFDARVALIRAAVRFLFRPPKGRENDTFVLKFRNYTTFDMEPYFAAFPNAHHLFLWRDAAGWTNSYHLISQLIRGNFDLTQREWLDFRWQMLTAGAPREIYARFDDLTDPDGAEEPLLAALWAASLETYFAANAKSARLTPFSYRQLNDARDVTVRRLLRACGLPEIHAGRAMKAYERHSQEDSFLAGASAMTPLSPAQHAKIAAMLKDHPAHALDED